MGLVFNCPLCGDLVKTRSFEIGDEITCPHCLARAIIPSSAEAFDDGDDPDLEDESPPDEGDPTDVDDPDLEDESPTDEGDPAGMDAPDLEDESPPDEGDPADVDDPGAADDLGEEDRNGGLHSDDLDETDTGEEADVNDSDETEETRPGPINGKDLHIRSIPQMLVTRRRQIRPGAMKYDRRLLYWLAVLMTVMAAGLIIYSYLITRSTLGEVSFGAEHVYYGRGAAEEQARRLGEYLARVGTFDGTGEKSVVLTANAPGYEIAFAVRDEAFEDREGLATTFEMLADRVSANVFEGAPVAITLKGSDADRRLAIDGLGARWFGGSSGSSEVFLRGEATIDEGRALEGYLAQNRFITPGQRTTLVLHKGEQAYRIELALVDEAFDDESSLRGSFQELADALSREVFQGLPVRIDLEDARLAPRITVSSSAMETLD